MQNKTAIDEGRLYKSQFVTWSYDGNFYSVGTFTLSISGSECAEKRRKGSCGTCIDKKNRIGSFFHKLNKILLMPFQVITCSTPRPYVVNEKDIMVLRRSFGVTMFIIAHSMRSFSILRSHMILV